MQHGLEDARELENEVVIGYQELENVVAIDYWDEGVVAYLDVANESQGNETQHVLEHYTTGSDRGMAEGWNVHPSWLEEVP